MAALTYTHRQPIGTVAPAMRAEAFTITGAPVSLALGGNDQTRALVARYLR